MRRSDSLKILFLCVCVCSLCPAHPCGDNPLLVVDHFSRIRGLRSQDLMSNLRLSTPETYNKLMNEYQAYMECTRAVQTGYYKRSVDSATNVQLQDTFSLDPYGNSNPRSQVVTNLLKNAIRQTVEQQQQEQNTDNLWDSINDASKNMLTSSVASNVPRVENRRRSISSAENKDLPLLIKRMLEIPNYDLGSSLLTSDDRYPTV